MIKQENFRRALKAALDGPQAKDVEWTSNGHDFNVKKAHISKVAGELLIDGTDGHHLSHRLRFRPDDQLFYKCRVAPSGDVRSLEINVKSSVDILKDWFETAGKIAAVAGTILGAGQQATGDGTGKADKVDLDKATPTPSSIELLDGDWRSDAEFLIANIITYATLREFPELATRPAPIAGFTAITMTVRPEILAEFTERRRRHTEAEFYCLRIIAPTGALQVRSAANRRDISRQR